MGVRKGEDLVREHSPSLHILGSARVSMKFGPYPYLPSPLPARAGCTCSSLLITTNLWDGAIFLHQQGSPTVGRQGLPIISADTAEEGVEDAPTPGLLGNC